VEIIENRNRLARIIPPLLGSGDQRDEELTLREELMSRGPEKVIIVGAPYHK